MVLLLPSCSRDYHSGRGFARLPPRAKPHWLSRRARPSSVADAARIGDSARGGRPRGLRLVERSEHIGRVTLGLDLRPDPRDPTGGIDQERPTSGPPVRLAVVLLLDP